ncbi:MAG TPA: TetR/AcrR family transcriptional regulator [Rhizobiales bacterium]|nr:TetR/AcrR family transcriptional regulator [Hyphomicrobiales bacterium]
MTLSVREFMPDIAHADILEAAALCFMERGYNATSIDDVARRLGATKGRIYHHYPAKADLFAKVCRTGMDMNYAAIEPVRGDSADLLERWTRMATIHTRQMMETRPFQRAVWEGVELALRGSTTSSQREELDELLRYRNGYGDIFREVIAQGRREGVFDFEDLGIANQLMFMALNSPIFWYTKRPGETEADREKIIRQVVTFAMRGLGGKRQTQ